MEITPNILEPNLIPITTEDIDVQGGMDISAIPASNTPATPPAGSNIHVSANGSIMSIGNLQSTNFHAGSSGWRLDSNGNIEANDGNFRGDITGASGTFSGTITAAAGSIGGWKIDATSIYTGTEDHSGYTGAAGDITFYSNGTVASIHGKEFIIGTDGKITCTSITATGTINAQAGYLASGVFIDSATAIVCESGGFNVGALGHIRGGQTDYNTGEGWWIGYDTTKYKLSIGDPDGDYFRWTGVKLESSYKLSTFIGGSGEDGDLVINDSGDTVLSADAYYDDLTISSNSTLIPNGWKIFVRGTCQIDSGSKIAYNGNDGSNGLNGKDSIIEDGQPYGKEGGVAGAALDTNSIDGSVIGQNGGQASYGDGQAGSPGIVGTATTDCITAAAGAGGGAGGAGGAGTAGGGGAGGAASAAGTCTASAHDDPTPSHLVSAIRMTALDIDATNTTNTPQYKSSGGSGSGGGGGAGGDSTGSPEWDGGGGGSGGGSGSGGGCVLLVANKLVNNGTIESTGGNGGNGGDGGGGHDGPDAGAGGGGGGAGGASGGAIVLVVNTYQGSGSTDVTGGAAGALGTGGTCTNCNPGNNGVVGTVGNAGIVFTLYG